jgi:hypothetical protein
MDLLARTEGVSLRPFIGSKALEGQMRDSIFLRVETASGDFTLESKDSLTIAPDQMRVAGLAVEIRDRSKLESAALQMVMDLKDVDVLIVAIDGPKSPKFSSEVLYRGSITELADFHKLNEKGSVSESGVLSNSNGAYSIEVALVHNKEISSSSGTKPRKNGALLSKQTFVLKPFGVDDMPTPKPMNAELKKILGLTPKSWIYFKATEALLTAESFEDAFDFYVDKELLDALQVANPEAKTALESLLLTSILQSLAYEAKEQYSNIESSEEQAQVRESAVYRLFSSRLKLPTEADVMEHILDSPSKAAASMLAVPEVVNGLLDTLGGGQND